MVESTHNPEQNLQDIVPGLFRRIQLCVLSENFQVRFHTNQLLGASPSDAGGRASTLPVAEPSVPRLFTVSLELSCCMLTRALVQEQLECMLANPVPCTGATEATLEPECTAGALMRVHSRNQLFV